jgi:hypothetical protein
MLRPLRTRASTVASVLLLSLCALLWPHIGDSHHDDDGEFAIVVAHDASGHGVGRPSSSDEEPHHCAICHSARTFRAHTQVTVLAASSVTALGYSCPDDFAPAIAVLAAQPPLRAPPASPTFV